MRALSRRLVGVSVPSADGLLQPARLAATAYVDDATVVLDQAKEVPVLVDTLEAFGEESGLVINRAKTKALPLGSWQKDTPLPFPYVDSVKVLGVVLARTVAAMQPLNWPGRLAALRGVLADARLRALNLAQRVEYANVYALSLIWHVAQVLPIPVRAATDARKAISRFLWAGEPLRVPLAVVVQPSRRGGLGLHDPLHKSRAMFTARWMTAARAEERTLSGAWLPVLTALFKDDETVSPAVRYFTSARETSAKMTVPDDAQGQALSRAMYCVLLEEAAVTPRVQLQRPAANWDIVWRRLASKALPVAIRAMWYRAVHDVLPTNARLKATRQADNSTCRACGAADDTVLHRLTICQAGSKDIWTWTAAKVAPFLDDSAAALEPTTMLVPDRPAASKAADDAVAWLLATTCSFLAETKVHSMAKFMAFAAGLERPPTITI